MLEAEKDVVTLLRIVGFLFLFAGVYPSLILTPIYLIASIMPHSEPFFYLRLLSVFYVISALGYFFVVKSRNLEKQGSNKLAKSPQNLHIQ